MFAEQKMKRWMYILATVPATLCLLACFAKPLHIPIWDYHSLAEPILMSSPIAYFAMIISIAIVARNETSRTVRILLILLNMVTSLPCSWALLFGWVMWIGFRQT